MNEGHPAGTGNLDHRRHVARHRNIFETNAPSTPPETVELGDERWDTLDRESRTIRTEAGKPCLITACICVCGHEHNISAPDTPPEEAYSDLFFKLTGERRSHCPIHGNR